MVTTDLERQVDHLARDLCRLVSRRAHHHLTAVHLACPEDVPTRALRALLTARLAEYGIDFVDLVARPGPGPVRLIAAYVEPDTPGPAEALPLEGEP